MNNDRIQAATHVSGFRGARSVRILLFVSLCSLLPAATVHTQPLDHAGYDEFLKIYVSEGMVDYRSVKENPGLLDRHLNELEKTDPDDFETWAREERMAFWINAYNAVTIHGIVRNYPIQYGGFLARRRFPQSSIRQIKDFWGTVFIKIMGRDITLDDIEHEILRKEYGDPRIHFALVCAAMGCPILSNDAYRGESLDRQLEHDATRFINNEDKVRLDTDKNILHVSSIFKWYRKDFSHEYDETPEWLKRYGKKERGIIATIVRYIEETKKQYIMENRPRIRYLDYDWALNELERK